MFSSKLVKIISNILLATFVMTSLIYVSQTEAKANQSTVTFSEEDIKAATGRTAGVADIIMTADDFLGDGERAADYKSIYDYLEEINKNGINDTVKDSMEESYTDKAVVVDDETEVAEEPVEAGEMEIEDEEPIEAYEEVNLDDWRLILVNKQNPVPEDYNAKLGNINGSLKADERIIDSIYEMLDAAEADGVDLMICSAYRSYDRQITLFNNKMNKLIKKGMSYMDAYAVGSMSVTVPGTSEHQLGLALDILTSSYTEMDDGFGETKAGKWLAENAPKYGFILRYPKDKEEITGIIYEPWHFRYVSTDYSEKITELGVTLEEYLNGEY